jgi:hypothetical protein
MPDFIITTDENVTGKYLVRGVDSAREAREVCFSRDKGMPNLDDERVEQLSYDAYCVEDISVMEI